jgi:hypothetical protein
VVAQKVVDLTLFDTPLSVKVGRFLHIYVGFGIQWDSFSLPRLSVELPGKLFLLLIDG